MYPLTDIIFRSIWSGVAALGFAVLFNVPYRALIHIVFMGAVCGLIKTLMLNGGYGVVESTWAAAIVIGFLCVPASLMTNVTPFSLAFNSVISMIPGYFAYRTFLGLMEMAKDNPTNKLAVLMSTIDNGLKVFFILTGLAVGVSIPILIHRAKVIRKIRFK
jgi:uncharacterized membrane protein YjjB (DUF3815 family)